MTCYPQIIVASDPSDTVKEKVVLENSNPISSGMLEKASCSETVPKEVNAEKVEVNECTEVAGPSTKCIFRDLTENSSTTDNRKPLFLSRNWREVLCRCEKCSGLYAQRGISFLLDKEDSIAEYERMAKQKRDENMERQEGAEMNFLNNLGHVEKMEILSGIADMKNEIFSFLVRLTMVKSV